MPPSRPLPRVRKWRRHAGTHHKLCECYGWEPSFGCPPCTCQELDERDYEVACEAKYDEARENPPEREDD